jgi:hypothetical protein
MSTRKSDRSLGSVREQPSVYELFIGTRENRGDVVQLRMVTVDGQPRVLNGFEISVDELVLCHGLILNCVGGCIEQQPDLMLTELQDRRLHGTCHLWGQTPSETQSTITIHWALRRRGFSRTRVIFPNTGLAMILLIQQVTRPVIERDEEDRAQYQLIRHRKPL